MAHGNWQLSEAEERDLELRREAARQVQVEMGDVLAEYHRRIEQRYQELLTADTAK